MKQEFQMTQQEMDDIIAINKSQMPVMKIGNVTTGMGLQGRINAYWEGLGDKYGFKNMTVEGSAKGTLYFLAEPKPIVESVNYKKLADEFDALNDKEQWEWALKHKAEITLSLDNDNTDFTFNDEDKTDDVTIFYFKAWIGTGGEAVEIVLQMMGFTAHCV